MDYYIKTRYLIKNRRNIFGKETLQIQLMCIGILCEDGRELYLTSNSWSHRWITDKTEHYLEDMANSDEWVSRSILCEKVVEFMTLPMHRDNDEIINVYYANVMDEVLIKGIFTSANHKFLNIEQQIREFISEAPDEYFEEIEHSRTELRKLYIEWNMNNESGNIPNILWRMKEWHRNLVNGKIKVSLLNA